MKEILNKCKKKSDFPNFFTVDGNKINDKLTTSNHFNNFFAKIGPSLSNKINSHSEKGVSSYLKQQVVSSFEFKRTNDLDVEKMINDLAPKHSCGHDGLSANFIKQISGIISGPLTLIINQSLSTGVFPDRLKIAKVIPIFKKGDNHILDNYRPISLLPTVSKLFEKIVFRQLYKYLTENKLLFTSRYGFREFHSTELAALELVDRVFQYLDCGKIPISVFLDMSKAFDTLDHNILIDKLKFYGLTNTPLNWFRSYLYGRQQYVDLDGHISNVTELSTGVTQGSILGPLLFIIYMNDIHDASSKFHFIIYADDTNLISPLCSFNSSFSLKDIDIDATSKHINTELGQIQEWLNINKLTLNVSKTKFMFFHHSQRAINNLIPKILINDEQIECVSEFNFLGLTIDEHLTWKPHIQKVSNKIARTLGVMCRLKNFLPGHILRMLYNSLVLPHLQYSILTWGFKASRLEKLQKRALRIITRSKYNAHTEPLFKKQNLLKLNDLFESNVLKLYYKFKKNILPYYIINMFSDAPTPNYDLRHRNILDTQYSNTPSGDKCIRFYLPKIINNTDTNILEKNSTHSYYGFVFHIKRKTLDSYSSECNIQNCYICSTSF